MNLPDVVGEDAINKVIAAHPVIGIDGGRRFRGKCRMRVFHRNVWLATLGVALVIMVPGLAQAIPAITCHCFTERTFNEAQPAAADPYFLAAAQNAFFANAFNIDRQAVVMLKQQGADTDNLWVAYWIASRTADDPDRLLRSKTQDTTWQEVLAPMQIPQESLGSRFSQALSASLPADRLAKAVVDELLVGYQLLDENQLAALRKAGAPNRELILAAVLATRAGRSARQIFHDVTSGARTWGAMLHASGIDGKNLPQVVTDTLKRPDRPKPKWSQSDSSADVWNGSSG